MKQIYVLLLIALLSTPLYTQEDRQVLESQRKKIIQEIEATSELLEHTSKEKEATLSAYSLLDSKIKKRASLIQSIQGSISAGNHNIARNKRMIDSLEESVLELKNQYSVLLRAVYLKEKTGLSWNHFLSFNSLNTAFRNWRYRKQFKSYIAQKKRDLSVVSERILLENKLLAENVADRNAMLKDERQQSEKLTSEQSEKDQLLEKLKKQEDKLKSKLAKGKREREKLNDAIEEAIIRSLKSKKPIASTSDSGQSLESMKGRLAWPTAGVITASFGNQPHPSLKNVIIRNNGIDISDSNPMDIKVVADGTIVAVSKIEGYDQMIIVQHDEYYTVYSKVSAVLVASGDQVRAGTKIGRISNRSEGKYTLHFELWKDKEKLNPAHWLKP